MFVPRENPRALFIRQSDQSPVTPSAVKRTPDIREMSTPVQANGISLYVFWSISLKCVPLK
jgi:hypothetical protein